MVQWLIYPTELGKVPDLIELMNVFPADPSRGAADYYLFRFRGERAGDSGFFAGVAGPFKRGAPTVHDLGDTFSHFDKWESATPPQHLQRILAAREETRGHNQKK
jgi:hypothetical protein